VAVSIDRLRPHSEEWLTIDELAASCGTSSRRVRSFQTLGLLPHPELRGRTGLYGPTHRERLRAILRLQGDGFSLQSIGTLFDALASGHSLADVLGLPAAARGEVGHPDGGDEAELYGFAELQPVRSTSSTPRRRPLLLVVPTTVWDESRAS
jgi:DNA-binding transcriptional MerR regulator